MSKTSDNPVLIQNVTQLYSVHVARDIVPETLDELKEIVKTHYGPISIGGGRFSMGGQIAAEGSLHVDMRGLNQIIAFSPEQKNIRVQAGIRWRDIQEHIDPHGLSVKIMQTYSNFTVGGSLSVNVHGRYIGLGPLILSVRSIVVMLADGECVEASPSQNPDIFYAAIGGYGAVGIIIEAALELENNVAMERQQKKMRAQDYPRYFKQAVRDTGKTVFHNADLYPPAYDKARAVSWVKTEKSVTVPHRLKPRNRKYIFERYFIWAITETPFGKWRREHIIDPLIYLTRPVVWRNYEASYDVAELEPVSREETTYVLQEYFVPVARFNEFVPKMAEILQRYEVNMLNISVRHAHKDAGSLLAWAREEVFAFVLYYKQAVSKVACNKVAVWTRELIEAAISCGGAYYLPYQIVGRDDQFHRAYPRAKELFALKAKYDPTYKFRNKLWDKYYMAQRQESKTTQSDFHAIYDDVTWQDKFYLFLQNVYRICPEDSFHTLIVDACKTYATDQEIYEHIQKNLPSIKPFLADIRYGIPALIKQKRVMSEQTISILGKGREINGYIEIGSTGRYIGTLRKYFSISGNVYLINDIAPGFSPVDIAERGQFSKIGHFLPLGDYDAIATNVVPDNSVDVVTCYIGLHHAPLDKIDAFVRSIARVLRAGGSFIVRDHDVDSQQMKAFVALAHTVFNAGLGVPWQTNANELRHFTSVNQLVDYVEARGLTFTNKRLLQDHDPSINVLMEFVKRS